MRGYLQTIQAAPAVQLLQDDAPVCTFIRAFVSQLSLKSVDKNPGDGPLHEESETVW